MQRCLVLRKVQTNRAILYVTQKIATFGFLIKKALCSRNNFILKFSFQDIQNDLKIREK